MCTCVCVSVYIGENEALREYLKELCLPLVHDSDFNYYILTLSLCQDRSPESKPKKGHTKPHNYTLFCTLGQWLKTVVDSIKYCYTRMGDRGMALEDYNMEKITHVRIDDRGFNVYISVCYNTMRLHAYKYDESTIEWESFTALSEFAVWIQKPIKAVNMRALK